MPDRGFGCQPPGVAPLRYIFSPDRLFACSLHETRCCTSRLRPSSGKVFPQAKVFFELLRDKGYPRQPKPRHISPVCCVVCGQVEGDKTGAEFYKERHPTDALDWWMTNNLLAAFAIECFAEATDVWASYRMWIEPTGHLR